jgi:hypothetical protein
VLHWIWARAEQEGDREEIERALQQVVTAAARRVLNRLYPETDSLLSSARRVS